MPLNPAYVLNFSLVDRSSEIGRFSINVPTDTDNAAISTAISDFENAVATVCDGIFVQRNLVVSKKLSNVAFSTEGQREEKWLLTYQDNVTLAVYQTELPCRKSSVKPPQGRDFVDLAVVPWIAFKTAFQAAVLSPEGNATTLLSVTLVGRNV